MQDTPPLALIAEDEPLLARALVAELARAWPQLRVAPPVGDGDSAVAQALKLQPDLLFLDIRMPGKSGLEAAAELADAWNPQAGPFPALVFVTAYDQYAVQAFEAQAVDYVLKPVDPARLDRTVARLRALLSARTEGESALQGALAQLRGLMGATANPSQPALTVIQASVGNSIRMVPVDEVLCFEADDKYIRVLTAANEYLIRTPLKELLPRLDANLFWQVHRGTVVRTTAIESVLRDEAGKLSLVLRGRREKLAVSRLYAHLFKAM
jgi:DNA-binding LytR/AlgR family response regulator